MQRYLFSKNIGADADTDADTDVLDLVCSGTPPVNLVKIYSELLNLLNFYSIPRAHISDLNPRSKSQISISNPRSQISNPASQIPDFNLKS